MSVAGSGDFQNDLLTAKERDLKPLLDESAAALDLDGDQTGEMEGFLNDAWFSGTRTGHAQMRARVMARKHDVGPVRVEEVETEFKALMEESAERLNLPANLTISMWDFLGRAWTAGTHTCEAELIALFIETRSDLAEEAHQWLEDEGEQPSTGDAG